MVADGEDAIADFSELDLLKQIISLGGGSRSVGHLVIDDINPVAGDSWALVNGYLDLSVSSGAPSVTVAGSNVVATFNSNLALSGDAFTKQGAGTLKMLIFPTNSIDIAAGELHYEQNGNRNFSTQAISGAGDLRFTGQAAGFYGFNDYKSALSYTGKTIVELDSGSSGWWYYRSLFLDRDNVLPPASLLELRSGKIYLRNQQLNGITAAGLTGNAGTLVTTDRAPIQKLKLNVAENTSYTYAGVIGVDGANQDSSGKQIALIKTGPGTQILKGANTMLGTITVENGTLLVNNTTGSGTGYDVVMTVSNGAALGGSGHILSKAVTMQNGSTLLPGGSGAIAPLTFSNLVVLSSTTYEWEYDAESGDIIEVFDKVDLPEFSTINLKSLEGASFPQSGVLYTYGTTNSGEKSFGGWMVRGRKLGTGITFTDDVENKQVTYDISYEADQNGTWNKGGANDQRFYSYANTANWVDGSVAGGVDKIARFDAVDAFRQSINLDEHAITLGQMIFSDFAPNTNGWWEINNGTVNLSVSSGMPVIAVSNTLMDVGFAMSTTLTGDFIKKGPGTLHLKNFPTSSIEIEAGNVLYNYNQNNTKFTTQSISGEGGVLFTGQSGGYFTFRQNEFTGSLTYSGDTVVRLDPPVTFWYQGSLWLEKSDVLPHTTVLKLLSGKIYTRAQHVTGLTIAGLSGNAGTFITTDKSYAELQKWTIDVSEGESYTYAGVIGSDGTAFGQNNIQLIKTGPGTQTLSGANTLVGSVTVAGGTLLAANTSGSATGIDNTVTIHAGAALGGNGTVLSSNVVYKSDAELLPGGFGVAGALTFGGNLTLENGVKLKFDCFGDVSDSVSVDGTLTLPESLSGEIAGESPLPEMITLFSAGSFEGASVLHGWELTSSDGASYNAVVEGSSVVAYYVAKGTVMIIR